MASIEECAAAIEDLAVRLSSYEPKHKDKKIPDRTLSLHVMDHDVMFEGHLHDGQLRDVEVVDPGSTPADIRLSMTSDDLLALTRGELHFAHAWATGRVRLDASIRDLLRLRSLG